MVGALEALAQPISVPSWIAYSGTALTTAVIGSAVLISAHLGDGLTAVDKQALLFGDVLRTVESGYVQVGRFRLGQVLGFGSGLGLGLGLGLRLELNVRTTP
ncbi:hypothetical protein T492DRAFT_123160 [Pavlovales sp. CCMP2436]|nr:hypothetical protein T492DRAFT_123160 [Pavlovales sp. CCMP2436]